MKPTNVKSHLLKRLIPVLLVPVVLSSNFAAISASADDEVAIEVNSQTNENETQVVEEQPVEEETAPEETAPEETAPEETGSDEAASESGSQAGEGSEDEAAVSNAPVDEIGNGLLNEGGAGSSEASAQEGSFEEGASEASSEEATEASSEASSEVEEQPEDDTTDPVVTEAAMKTLTELVTYEKGTVAFGTSADDFTVTAKANDVADSDGNSDNGIDEVKIRVNGKWVPMKGNSDSDEFTWKPDNYGVYFVEAVKAFDGSSSHHASEEFAVSTDAEYICYYKASAKPGYKEKKNSADSGVWFTKDCFNGEDGYYIEYQWETNKPVEAVSFEKTEDEDGADDSVATTSFSCEFDPDHYRFNATARLEIPVVSDGEGQKLLPNLCRTYEVSAQFYGDSEFKTIDTHKVWIDVTDIDYRTVKVTRYQKTREATERDLFGRPKKVTYTQTYAEVIIPEECLTAFETKFAYADVTTQKAYCDLIPPYYHTKDEHVCLTADPEKYDESENHFIYNIYLGEVKDGTIDEIFTSYDVIKIAVYDNAGNTSEGPVKTNDLDNCDFGNPIIEYKLEGEFSGNVWNDWKFSKSPVTGFIHIYETDLTSATFTALEEGYPDIADLISKEPVAIEERCLGLYYDYKYQVNLDLDKQFYFDTVALDAQGHTNNAPSDKIIVDREKPVISIDYNGDGATPKQYYNDKNLYVAVTVTDKWFNADASTVFVTGTDVKGDTVTFSSKDPGVTWSGEVGEDVHTVKIPVATDGKYHVEVKAEDLAKNESSVIATDEFIRDTDAPRITIKWEGPDAVHGKYYNDIRTAHVYVEDFTFYPETSKVSVNSEYGSATPSEWKAAAALNTYESTIVFKNDGIYSFKVTANDHAGNGPVYDNVDEFVIDRTAPVITISYNNNSPKNGFYFNTERIGTIKIDDLSFTSDKFRVTQIATEDAGNMPSVASYSTSGKETYATLYFTDDGSYSYTIDCEDLAGNKAETVTADMFVIDRTVPEVKFSGVENYSANNGKVAPVVSYVDKNMDINISHVTMTGANNGAVDLANKVDKTENGFVVSYSDFEHVKGMDDLYVLQAHVVDLAGNENKDQLVFSVNRFGSVFVLGSAAKELNEQYYTKEPVDISVTEINVDDLVEKTVSISRDGDIKELKSGKQYTVSKQGSDTSWKTYTYTVSKDNFEKDGIYSVTVYTRDRATNVQDNKSRDAEINFAVDKTAPSIVTVGLENGEVYKEASHTVNIDVTDNMGVTSLKVYKDGKEVESYDEKKLLSDNGVESITLTESDNKQSVKIVAQDVAGNIETVEFSDILVSTKETEILSSDNNDSEGIDDGKTAVLGKSRTRGLAGFIVLACGVIAAGTGAGVSLYKKKHESASED